MNYFYRYSVFVLFVFFSVLATLIRYILNAGDSEHLNKFQSDICDDPKHINKYVITDLHVCKKHRKFSQTQQLLISAVI